MEAKRINDFNSYKISDTTIVQRVIAGEKQLYEILLRRNNQKLFRVIRSYLKETQEIEDIMQNTYLKAFEKLHQFKYNSTFSTWLIRIGINEALARLKTKGRVFILNENDEEYPKSKILEIPNERNQLNPEQEAIRNETKIMLEKAIDNLELKYRSVYMLREIEEMSMAEISDCLNLSVANVKVRLHRAKAKIKENLFTLSASKDVFEFGFSKCDTLVEKVMQKIF